ncbi:unnamed protein product [Fusarium graminearum]|uniref:Chromosome 3, complete genome n=1 Tax=Gibberella zeae (strain ATCC MYA-4620 / CBS 123657 / FGSC 9075 / NRRL 31084 / PH-1) TaxID=229533 RepID=A0A0E0SN75_GIBZE|nr:hypothetical protein FG05_30336 [Fusarium graminearum]KAI6758065.1 hypothetical protein HG531_003890 [Fusarium graminearum]CAF3473983.1 unnamed protein product [Fusarium graminearum]CEF87888.1 unnamed protein product [Fusarium graminearum]
MSSNNIKETTASVPKDLQGGAGPDLTDGREQPWKKFLAAENECNNRPWTGWQPTEEKPFEKPWLRWSVEFGVDNFRHMTGS